MLLARFPYEHLSNSWKTNLTLHKTWRKEGTCSSLTDSTLKAFFRVDEECTFLIFYLVYQTFPKRTKRKKELFESVLFIQYTWCVCDLFIFGFWTKITSTDYWINRSLTLKSKLNLRVKHFRQCITGEQGQSELLLAALDGFIYSGLYVTQYLPNVRAVSLLYKNNKPK